MKFKKVLLDKENKCEACSVADFNNDGKLEILCGEYLYSIENFSRENFSQKTKICDITYDGDYVHDFSDYPLDVNGDGYLDVITGSWWGEGLYWRENPGASGSNTGGAWKLHLIEKMSNVETIRFFDIDNCGTVEIFPNTPGEPQSYFKLIGPGKFKRFVISEGHSGHGLGFGDMNGNGKTDIILYNGWLEQPKDVFDPTWKFHGGFDIPGASVPMIGFGNGFIAGAGHGYGLWWFERKNGEFIRHEIDMIGSQYHDMQLCDIDNDGEPELITGARYFAHNGNDPGELNPIGTYIFKIKKSPSGELIFEKRILDYGMPEDGASGVGIYFWLEDLTGNGYKDIIAPGKEGLYIFYNEGDN